jgi:hypothetical protein
VSDERIGGIAAIKHEKTVVVKREKMPGEDSETESEDDDPAQEEELVGMEVFDNIVRPPFKIPGDSFDGREPWFFQEYT